MTPIFEPIIPLEPVASEDIPSGPRWLFQIKWDGVRILTYYDGRDVRLYNRRRHERTGHYPELTDIASYARTESVILDGEVIALGPDGKPSFHQVMKRDSLRRLERVPQAREAVPVTYMVFDILYHNGVWLTKNPLEQRLATLNEIIRPASFIQPVGSHEDGLALFKVIAENGLEGIVAKKRSSPYLMGEKKNIWLKIKNYRDLVAVIGGFTLRNGTANALLLGLYNRRGQLWYVGHVGTGKLSQAEWRALTKLLQSLAVEERPFANLPERHRDAFWVKPLLTVKIIYAQWTEGCSLRQPSIQALVDYPPANCLLEDNLNQPSGARSSPTK